MKKMLLLASMALAALAFAIPASAMANGHFTDNHKPIEGSVEQTFSGSAKFSSAGVGSYTCIVHVTATVETLGGTIKKFEPTPETCVGTGAFTGCKLTEANASGELTPTAGTDVIDIKNFTLYNKFSSCLVAEVHLQGELKAEAHTNAEGTITGLTVSGELEGTNGLKAIASGELEATGEPTLSID